MDVRTKRVILERRIEMLRGHIDCVDASPDSERAGASPGIAAALEKAERELRELG